MEESLELYTCSASSPDSEMPAYARNGTVPRAYNELATLMSVTGGAPRTLLLSPLLPRQPGMPHAHRRGQPQRVLTCSASRADPAQTPAWHHVQLPQ